MARAHIEFFRRSKHTACPHAQHMDDKILSNYYRRLDCLSDEARWNGGPSIDMQRC